MSQPASTGIFLATSSSPRRRFLLHWIGVALLVASACRGRDPVPKTAGVKDVRSRQATSDVAPVRSGALPGPITVFDYSRLPHPDFRDACERARSLGQASATESALYAYEKAFGRAAVSALFERLRDWNSAARASERPLWDELLRRVAAQPQSAVQEWLVLENIYENSVSRRQSLPQELLLPDGHEPVAADPEVPEHCVQSGEHAWTVVAEALPGQEPDLVMRGSRLWTRLDYEQFERLAYVPRKGQALGYLPEQKIPRYAPITPTLAYDFDLDGIPEGVYRYSFYNEGTTDREFWILTAKDDRIDPYPMVIRNGPRNYELEGSDRLTVLDIADKTGDGRPDLLLAPVVYEISCGSGFDYEQWPIELLAEGLSDGTFDLRTPTAIRFALAQCPKLPSTLKGTKQLACAKLWGLPDLRLARHANELLRRGDGCPEGEGGASPADSGEPVTPELGIIRMEFPYRISELGNRSQTNVQTGERCSMRGGCARRRDQPGSPQPESGSALP